MPWRRGACSPAGMEMWGLQAPGGHMPRPRSACPRCAHAALALTPPAARGASTISPALSAQRSHPIAVGRAPFRSCTPPPSVQAFAPHPHPPGLSPCAIVLGPVGAQAALSLCRGVGAMEIVAMDMKVSGMYIARQLSFSGVTFRVEEIPLDPAFERVYNRAALLVSRPRPTLRDQLVLAAPVLGLSGHRGGSSQPTGRSLCCRLGCVPDHSGRGAWPATAPATAQCLPGCFPCPRLCALWWGLSSLSPPRADGFLVLTVRFMRLGQALSIGPARAIALAQSETGSRSAQPTGAGRLGLCGLSSLAGPSSWMPGAPKVTNTEVPDSARCPLGAGPP